MKKHIFTAAVSSLVFALAQQALAEDGKSGPDFAKHKQEMSAELDQEISQLQTAKTCVSGAADHDAMKKCRETLHKAREDMHAQMKAKRKENLDERIKKLQDEKAKMDEKSAPPAH